MKKLISLLLILPTFTTAQCWQSIDAGANHTLAIRNDGTLWSWGNNDWGKLGQTQTTISNPIPNVVGNENNWQTISAGDWHSAGIKTDGKLWTWGNNFYGQCGNGTSGVSADGSLQQIGNENWFMVSCGLYYTLLIKSDGTLWSMGDNTYGQHGLGNSFSITPAQIGTDNIWKQVSANYNYSIGLKTNGTLWAWGTGYLGNGIISTSNIPVQIGIDSDWDKIATSGTFAIKTNGTLWGWGYNQFGQLGDGTTINKPNPVQIGTDTNWIKISNHYNHTLATKTDNSIWAWGDNDYGQLGDATLIDKIIPLQIGVETNWSTISNGEFFSIAIKSDGTLFTWGVNYDGRLGIGSTTDANIPTQVSCFPLNTDNFLDISFIVYPNPTKDFINIEKNDNLIIDEFIVIDIYGKVVIDEKNLNDKLNIQQLQNGIYLLQINCQNRKLNYKIIKE